MGVNVLQELSAEQMKFKAEITEDRFKYKNHVLDLSQAINEPKFLFNIGNIPSIPAGELIGIKGRAKQGKSQWEYILISVMLSGISKGDVMPLQDRYKVFIIRYGAITSKLKEMLSESLKICRTSYR